MPCVRRNFLFLLTGIGKAFFNIMVGTLLFLNAGVVSQISAWALIVAGLLFLYLSKVKQMSDVDLNRAMSVYAENNTSYLKNSAKKYAHEHKDDIRQAAIDHKDVIAQVAYDNREAIDQVAYDNR